MPDDAHSPTEVKGAVIKQIVKSTFELMSASEAQALKAIMKIPSPIFDGTWYDVRIPSDFVKATRQCCKVDDAFLRTMGKNTTDALLNGVHRFLIRSVSAHVIVQHSPLYFGNFYRGGTIDVKIIGPGHAHVTYCKYDNISRDLWLAIGSGIIVGLEAAKAKNVSVQIISSASEKNTRFEYKWVQ